MCSFVVFLIHRDYLAIKITNYKHSLNILVNENEIRQGFEIERVKPLISDPANAHSTNDTHMYLDKTRDIRSNLPLGLKEFPWTKPGKGVYFTVYPEYSPNSDSIRFTIITPMITSLISVTTCLYNP